MSWHYTSEKIDRLIKQLSKSIIRAEKTVDLTLHRAGVEPYALLRGQSYLAAAETVTLTGSVTIPAEWDGERVHIALEITGAESLVRIDDIPVQAIDLFHHDLLLVESAIGGKTYQLQVEAYTGTVDTNQNTSWIGGIPSDGDRVTVTLKQNSLQCIDRDVEALYFDLKCAQSAVTSLPADTLERSVIERVLDETVNILDFRFPHGDERLSESARSARQYIAANLYDKYSADPAFTPIMRSVGHAHIDTAWLWPLAHTRQKIARTFSTQLTYVERFADTGYVFACSQPQQYAYLKQDHPDIYARVKKAVETGRWETVGGMWVESDCNVVSGESLVRQFLFGQRFFQKEFGTHNDVLWLPDVFGYAANIPQIIKKVGMKYFMTIKIYWSQINKPPYQTFEWEGIDGTRVLTHFAPGGDYNSAMTPQQVVDFWGVYKQKNVTDTALYIFGNGDGGGGPTREMLETAKRLKNFPQLPRVQTSTVQNFFETLEQQTEGNPALPRWVGELYLEYHRGTYTSQARNKNFNRRSEIALQTAEQVGSAALILSNEGFAYPQDEINQAWELALLNQFHDIIPGSSIAQVYEDSTKDYGQILNAASEAASSGLTALAASVDASVGDVLVYNPLPWSRTDYAALPASLGLSGQKVTSLDGESLTLVTLSETQPTGYTTIARPNTAKVSPSTLYVTDRTLENKFFKVTLDDSGEIVSIFDKRVGFEVVDSSATTRANALLTFEDLPMNYEAWDIDIYYQDKVYPVTSVDSIQVVEEGPIRASIEIKRSFGRGSTVVQRISLWEQLPRIDFDTKVDWQERSMLLKTAFPVNVHSPRATFDIQFGNVERPTHWNTSWDWARFEVCGHKWADLSEGGDDGYGVALLSYNKYGWDIKGNVMRLTLLKGAEDPDKGADVGVHHTLYSLVPHIGDWRQAEVVQRAYELNVPVLATAVSADSTRILPSSFSLASIDAKNLIIETIKKAEDDGSLIVRLYEAYGKRGEATLLLGRDFKSIKEVNLMEDETDETRSSRIDVNGESATFRYLPYEIKTLKVEF